MNAQKERFDKDVENHTMTVIKDDGVHRHLHCSSGSSCYHFDIVTYPGYLVYSGDMGCFVFRRVNDMFQFFRNAGQWINGINPGYWGEKLEAGNATEFSEEYFMGIINGMVSDICKNVDDYCDDVSQKDLEQKADEFKTEVKEYFESNDLSAGGWYTTMYNFESDVIPDFDFSCDWDDDCTEHTTRFIWCCHALVWAIGKYDKQDKEKVKQSNHDSMINNIIESTGGEI